LYRDVSKAGSELIWFGGLEAEKRGEFFVTRRQKSFLVGKGVTQMRAKNSVVKSKMKGGENMKKALIFCLMVAMVMIVGYGYSEAAVSGSCQQCHTMHNSQGNADVATDETGATTATVFGHLTRSSCEGCHNGIGLPAAGAPNIFGTAINATTAGGTFSSSVVTAPAMVHNVSDIDWVTPGIQEVTLAADTPGRDTSETNTHPGTPQGAAQLTCAGTAGCHGNHDVAGSDAGITGFHHMVSGPYRFLQTMNASSVHTGIGGQGAADWEAALISTGTGDKNIYLAGDGAGNNAAGDTISSLCAMCHGNFHGATELDVHNGSVWTRHPTDANISALNGTPTVDYISNPFGFDAAAQAGLDPTSPYDETNAQVVCVSCHRAHGTDQNDLLRFDYGNMSAGSTTVTSGCLGCHVDQRG
jgi:predicted CXXCH cytochrome family protein